MKERMKRILETVVWGKKEKTYTLRKQLSRVIVISCILAVSIQAIVMVGIMIKQYIQQERRDITYILENDNAKMEKKLQYLGEMALRLRHNLGLKSFFQAGAYKVDIAIEQLENTVSVFAERNILENSEPFIEKIYLFNRRGESISQLYYPITVSKYEAFNRSYQALYEEFTKQKEEFYFVVEEENLHLCMNLYHENMKPMGACIFTLNREGMEKNYENIETMGRYHWRILQGERVLLEKGNLLKKEEGYLIEDKIEANFGLALVAAVSEFVIIKSLWSSILITVITSAALILLLSLMAGLLSRYYVKPLETVAEKIRQVGKGNFDTKLDEYRVEELQNVSQTFNEMTDYINTLIREVYETQIIAKQAEIQYLQAQTNPHFLFNVLSMIEMRAAINGDKDVQTLIYQLSKLYQGKIFKKNEPVITLSEEMEITEFYLSLQNSRFGNKITYSICYEGEKEVYDELLVPRLSIEPIVENAVCHGLEPKEEDGHISVTISIRGRDLEIEIEDDGIGFDSKMIMERREDRKHTHVGIWNTDKMIHNLYGEAYGLKISSKVGVGTKVLVKLPVRRKEYVEGYDS